MKITALLPIKNGEPWILRSITSIAENLRLDDELLIIDDGSTDNSRALAKSIGSHLSMRILKNPGNGLVDALNYGVSKSKSDWVARFDVDDLYAPSRLEVQRQLIKNGVAAIFSDYTFRSESGQFLGEILSPVSHKATTLSLLNSQRTAHPSSLFSKEEFNRAGGYRERDFPAEDLSLWIRLSRVGELVSSPVPLLEYTLRKGSITGERYNLAKSKHSELFHELNFGRCEARAAIENLDFTLSSYGGIHRESLRFLLHLYDLMTAVKLGFLPERYLKRVHRFAIKEIFEKRPTKELLDLVYFRSQRRRFRRFK